VTSDESVFMAKPFPLLASSVCPYLECERSSELEAAQHSQNHLMLTVNQQPRSLSARGGTFGLVANRQKTGVHEGCSLVAVSESTLR